MNDKIHSAKSLDEIAECFEKLSKSGFTNNKGDKIRSSIWIAAAQILRQTELKVI